MQGSDRPVFVVGCPRSGTTLFRTMLNAHPRIAVAPETRYLMWLYHRRAELGDLRERGNREQLARLIVANDERRTRFRLLGLDPDEVTREIVDGPPTLGSAFGVILRAYARRFDKPRWGDKRPSYYSFMNELDHLFPDAQFINVIRDPRACVESLMRQEWYPDKAGPCTAAWIHAVREARLSGRRLGPARYFEVRYEELVADPEASSRAVCEFLEEPYAEQMCHPEEVADQVVPAPYQQRRQILEGVNTVSLRSWEKRLTPDEITLIERTARRPMKQLGYAPVVPGGHAALSDVVDVVRRHRAWHRRISLRRLVDEIRLAAADNGIAAQLTSEQRRLAAQPHGGHLRTRLLRAAAPAVGPRTRRLRRLVMRAMPHRRIKRLPPARVTRPAPADPPDPHLPGATELSASAGAGPAEADNWPG